MSEVPDIFCGGLFKIENPTDEVRDLLKQVRAGCETKAGKTFPMFEPIHFRTQLVNGINFFVKVKVAENEFIHVRAHKSFQGEVSLWGIQTNQESKTLVDYFE